MRSCCSSKPPSRSPLPQVLPCPQHFSHDWTECPFAHPGERATRRAPHKHGYTGVGCTESTACLLIEATATCLAGQPVALPDLPNICSSVSVPHQPAVSGTRALGPRAVSPVLPPVAPAGVACPSMKRDGSCAIGAHCPYSHNVFEYWLHPTR